ncbi:MAG: HPr family phosphocarrier protein [Cellulosilyticum sp.]|nr:HPr family phosphocarrier protein [Cellulosilyticum sp.]
MKSIYITLNSIEKVKQFVNTINTYDSEFDLSSGRYIIDAKSIMGIFSLDLSAPLRLDIYNDDCLEAVKQALNEFIIDPN